MRALVLKLAFLFIIVALVVRPAVEASMTDAFWIALVLTAALYSIGDFFVLRYWGNGLATAVDAGTAALLVWWAPAYVTVPPVPPSSVLAAAGLVALAEYVFHGWLLHHVFPGAPVDKGRGGDPDPRRPTAYDPGIVTDREREDFRTNRRRDD